MTEAPRLHPDEVPVGTALVHALLKDQAPHLAERPLRLVDGQGTDNVVFRLGDDLSVRLPRKATAATSLEIEREWLPRLAPGLPLSVPAPVVLGEPAAGYPFPWTVCTWVPGAPVAPGSLGADAARTLGAFVGALQGQDATGGPVRPGWRAGPLADYAPIALRALDEVVALQASGRVEADLLDERAARRVWADAVAAPAWTGADVWVHRDLLGGNVLAESGRPTGVIDFGGLAVGDPAGNAMGAFHLFDRDARQVFLDSVGADAATVRRARGWALAQGLEALPYYLDSHSGMVAMARWVLRSTLEGV